MDPSPKPRLSGTPPRSGDSSQELCMNLRVKHSWGAFFLLQLPKSLIPHYCEIVSANPKSRPKPSDLLSSLREHGGYLSNQFISIALRIEELQVRRK